MDKNLHNIEDLFKNALDDDQQMPSSKVWDNIDENLDKDNVIKINRKYVALKRAAFILFFCLTGLSIYEIRTNQFKNYTVAKQESKKEIIVKKQLALNEHGKGKINRKIVKDLPVKNSDEKANTSKPVIKKRNNIETIISASTHNKDQETLAYLNIHLSKNKTSETANEKKQTTNSNVLTYEKSQTTIEAQVPQLQEINRRQNVPLTLISLQSNSAPKFKSTSAQPNDDVVQNARKNLSKQHRFSLTAFYSPEIGFYNLRDNDIGQGSVIDIENNEKYEYSSSVGALLNCKQNKHWSLTSGVTFSNTNITLDPQIIFAQADDLGEIKYRLNTSSGYAYLSPSFITNPLPGDSLYVLTTMHTLNYISIPLLLKYTITKGNFNINATSGIFANILSEGKIETSYNNGSNNESEKTNDIKGLKSAYVSGFAGIGFDYNLSRKWTLSFSPGLRFALNSINKDGSVKSFPNSLGLSFGITHEL